MASPRRLPPLFSVADGMRDGQPATVGATLLAYPGTSMGAVTGVPAAVGASLMLSGQAGPPGVRPPEAAFQPEAFFEALARQAGWSRHRVPVLVTRSWDDDPGRAYRRAMAQARRALGGGADGRRVLA